MKASLALAHFVLNSRMGTFVAGLQRLRCQSAAPLESEAQSASWAAVAREERTAMPRVTFSARLFVIGALAVVAMGVGSRASAASPTIAAGGEHTCAVTSGGGVKCWGFNYYGQLGDGSNTNRLIPADVTWLTSGVTAIAADGYHTCALTSEGGLKCWGWNDYGQLGDGTIGLNRLTPVDVAGLTSDVTAIAAGPYHSCAITTGGGVKCWGRNDYGQLGDGTSVTNRLTPVDVTELTSGVTAIAGGEYHTCALTSGGGVKCWGYNLYGQLGDGTGTNRSTPASVTGLTSGVTAIAAGGYHTCALTNVGGVKCWGINSSGQVGDGTSGTARAVPFDVTGLTSGVTAITAGQGHTCALTSVGEVKCWGYNDLGQVGDGTNGANRLIPVDVTGLPASATTIIGGGYHTCALISDGGVKCWGYNSSGQLGDGTSGTSRLTPVDVSGLNLTVGIALTSSQNSSLAGQLVTFVATVSGNSPTGTVEFRDGTAPISGCASQLLASGEATCGTTALSVGSHSISAVYSGDANNPGITSEPLIQSINLATSSTTLTASLNPSSVGQSVTFTATVGGSNPTGAVTFSDGQSVIASCTGLTMAGGQASCTTSALSAGAHSITAAYGGDASNTSSVSAPLTQVVNAVQVSTTTAVTSSANPSMFGQVVTFTAMVSGTGPTGTVAFKDGVASITGCTARPVSGGQATCATSALALGSHSITATYSGDAINLTSTSTALVQTVLPPAGPSAAAGSVFLVTNGGGASVFGYQTEPPGLVSTLAGVDSPRNMAIGRDGHLYVTGLVGTAGKVLRFNGETGAFIDVFATTVDGQPFGLAFGPDGHLYVVNSLDDSVSRFDGVTGALLGAFVPSGTGGVDGPRDLAFGPDGTLYLSAFNSDSVHRFSVAGTPLGLAAKGVDARGFAFGPDGMLYVADFNADAIVRFDPETATSLGTFASGANLDGPAGLAFGPDGGLYVTSFNNHRVLHFNGTTGAFVRTIAQGSGLVSPRHILFVEREPTVVAGYYHSCALTQDGGVKCWGQNTNGQLGNGTTSDSLVPVTVQGISGARAIAAGAFHTCALTSSDGVKCWGRNTYGQLGSGVPLGSDSPIPATVAELSGNVAFLGAGAYHNCVVTKSGSAKCWGLNSNGQLGNGTTTLSATPVDVTGLSSDVVGLDGGGAHTCAILTLGNLKCWGRNSEGQLGNGSTTEARTPVDVSGLSDVELVVAGARHVCAVLATGAAKCWGENVYGQLGVGSPGNRSTPADVVGLSSGVHAIAAGEEHACALVTGGAGKCWGRNTNGQLGNGSTSQSLTPVDITGLIQGTAIGAGVFHTCAVLAGGGVKCWGMNNSGQTGIGSAGSNVNPPAGFVVGTSLRGSVVLGSYPNPSGIGQPVKITASVPGHAPSGIVTFYDGGAAIAGCEAIPVGAGKATCTNTVASAGSHAITAVYWGDGNHPALASPVLTQVVSAVWSTSTALDGSPNPSTSGQSVSFTATISGTNPTGTVAFQDNGTPIAACAAQPLSGGEATCTTSALSVGSHNITGVYSGDASNGGSASSVLVQVVNRSSTTTTLVSSPNPSTYGQSVTLTAYVTGFNPSGTVDFKDGGVMIAGCGALALSGGQASCVTNALSVGSHAITAGYSGDANNVASTSSALSQSVGRVATTTVVASSLNPSTFGQAVTFTATLTGTNPTGTVTFSSEASAIASCTAVAVAGGQASCTTGALAVGSHSITAAYGGDAINDGSVSVALVQSVNPLLVSTTTALVTSASASIFGEAVTFTATVTGASSTGSVEFRDGAAAIAGCGARPLSGSQATCTTTALTRGNHNITAIYGGDASHASSSSAAVVQTVLSAVPAATALFVSDYLAQTISRSNPDGTSATVVRTGLSNVRDIAVDAGAAKLYYLEQSPNRLSRANLDGSNPQVIVNAGNPTYALALDTRNGKVYWSEYPVFVIRRANLDGTNVETLPLAGLDNVNGLAIDAAAGKLYWSEFGSGRIGRSNLDGTGSEVIAAGRNHPNHIALDTEMGHVYWTEAVSTIVRANQDGSNLVTLVTGQSTPAGLALDLATGKMIWATESGNSVWRANLDGSQIEVIRSGMSKPLSVALLHPLTVVATTPVGSDVPVDVVATLPDGSTEPVIVTFDTVVTPGQTSVTTSTQGPPPPTGFKLGNPPVYYDVSTTATFSGGAELCFSWEEGQFNNEGTIRLRHYEAGAWVDVTSTVDTTNNIVCGVVTSLSPFALTETAYQFAGFFAPVDNMPVLNSMKAGQAVPVKFGLGGNRGLDVFAPGHPASQAISCSGFNSIDSVETTTTAGASTLQYDSISDRYTYVWKTESAWAGTCRTLILKFSDGSQQQAVFQFRK